MRQILPAILKHLHFQTDTDALALVVDSDNSVPHTPEHEQPGRHDPLCRLCSLREIAIQVQSKLPTANRAVIKVAVGLAVPAIEGWLHCGRDPHVTELALLRAMQKDGHFTVKARLKKGVYGTERPPLKDATAVAIREAARLASQLEVIERHFPGGFGCFARDCRSW